MSKGPSMEEIGLVSTLDRVDRVVDSELCDRQGSRGVDGSRLCPRDLEQRKELLVPLDYLVRPGRARERADPRALGLPCEAGAGQGKAGENDRGECGDASHRYGSLLSGLDW